MTQRPFLSFVIHVPVVLLGGEKTFLWSRLFVWTQYAIIAWLWVSATEAGLGLLFSWVEKVCVGVISFAVSVHTFPIMAWHTIDGLFLTTAGVLFVIKDDGRKKCLGYFLLGLAYLCKQSFMFTGLASIILLNDWRKLKCWVAVLAPATFYAIYLFLNGALRDAVGQLTAHTELFYFGVVRYCNWGVIIGVLIGYICANLIHGGTPAGIGQRTLAYGGLIIVALVPPIGRAVTFISGTLVLESSFWTFGLLLGITLSVYWRSRSRRLQVQLATLVLVVSWGVALSLGYGFPSSAEGAMITTLIGLCYPLVLSIIAPVVRMFVIGCVTVLILVSFYVARVNYIHYERPAVDLTMKLDHVFPGANGIRTNPETYAFLSDLKQRTEFASRLGKTYSIMPDCPGWWVKSKQRNVMPIDWLYPLELAPPEVIDRIEDELAKRRGENIIIVQKEYAALLPKGRFPVRGNSVVDHVRNKFEKIAESEFFELYR